MSTAETSTNWYTGALWRGVDYSPTWPTWVVGPSTTQTNDSDFANDAFQSLWSDQYQAAPSGDPSVPVDNNGNYRDDLQTISQYGFNLIRLYNWDMARGTTAASNVGLDHINFLNYAESLGLKVVVPISDYFLGDDQYSWNNQSLSNYDFGSAPAAIQTDFIQFIASITDPTTQKIHSAVHSISVGNEGDIGQGISGTTASNFLARTIWWIVNLHQQINGSGTTGPDGNPVVNGAAPIILLSATFSNADQGGSNGSWFQCLVQGVTAQQATPNGCALGSTFATAVTGLSSADSNYASYYYNSTNISQVSTAAPYSNSLASTLALYDSGASPWPGGQMTVPLLLMEVFTPNRTGFPASNDQAVAAIGQVLSLETYLAANSGGTANSTTFLMGYNYFEFNDEQEVKLTGLYQYTGTSTSAQTGTTSVDYGTFPDYTFPVYDLTATPSGDGNGTLIGTLQGVIDGFTVQANQSWLDTGIYLQTETTVIITYQSGLWTADPQTNDGNLYDANGCPSVTVTQPGYPLPNAKMGALVGQIGDNPVFLIGDGPTTTPAGQSGGLMLCINDDLKGLYGAGLTDNSGSVTVKITT